MASVKDVPSCTIVSIRKTQPKSSFGSFLSASAISLLVYLTEVKISPSGPGFTIQHQTTDDSLDAEVAIPTSSKGEDRRDIHFREASGGKAAFLVVKGGYENLKSAHDKVKEYCSSNGHTVKEVREVYLKGPRETQNSDEYETEVQYLI